MVQQSPLKMGLTQPSVQWVPRVVRSVYSGRTVKLFTDIISFVQQECNELRLHISFSLHIVVLRHIGHNLSLSGLSRCDENELGLRIKDVDHIQRKPVMYPRGYIAVFLWLMMDFFYRN